MTKATPVALAAMTMVAAAGAARAQATQTVEVVGAAPLQGALRPLAVVPAPVQTTTAEAMKRLGALDVTEQMNRAFGSVHLNELQGNPLQADLSFRGFTASPLLGTPQGLAVYMDGIRMNQPFGDVVGWDLIPKNALSRVTLVPGSNPVFGLNALGGSLVLETKDGRSDAGGDLGLTAASGGRWIAEGTFGRAIDAQWDVFVAAQAFQERGWRDASASAQQQAFGKLGWRPSKDTAVKLTLAHAETDLNGNGLQERAFLQQRWQSVFTRPDNTRNIASLLALSATHEASRAWSFSANASLRRITSHTLNADVNEGALDQNLYFNPTAANVAALTAAGFTGFPTVRETAANTTFPTWACVLNAVRNEEPNEKCSGLVNRTSTQQTALALGAQATWRAKLGAMDNELIVGLAHERSRVAFTQSSEFGAIQADRSVRTTGVFADGTQDSEDAFDARTDLSARTRTTSLYASNLLALTPNLHATLNARWNDTRVTMVDNLDPTGGAGTLNGAHRFRRVNPSVGLVARMSPAWSVYGSFGESSRAPTATELGCADPADPCRLPNAMAADPPLKQVVTRTAELGVRGGVDGLRWSLGVFRSDNQDDIQFVAAQTAGTGYFRNVARTRRQGLEASIAHRVSNAWRWGAAYTLVDATFQTPETLMGASNSTNSNALDGEPGVGEGGTIDVKPGDRLPLQPRHMLKAFAEWHASAALSLGADVLAIGRSFARGNENNRHQPDGTYYADEGASAGYALLNLNARWQFAPRWSLAAKVTNALDRRYTTGAVLGATPFNAAGGVDARQRGSYLQDDGSRDYVVRQTTLFAPGAPRQLAMTLRYEFD